MSVMASQISSLTSVYSTVYLGADQRKKSKLRVTGLCAGNSPVTGEFPAQRASNAENVSIWWSHRVWPWTNELIHWDLMGYYVIAGLCYDLLPLACKMWTLCASFREFRTDCGKMSYDLVANRPSRKLAWCLSPSRSMTRANTNGVLIKTRNCN